MCTDKKRKLTWIKNIVNIYRVLHRTVYIHRVYTESHRCTGKVGFHSDIRRVKRLHVGHVAALSCRKENKTVAMKLGVL